jgi:hypothetical protein
MTTGSRMKMKTETDRKSRDDSRGTIRKMLETLWLAINTRCDCFLTVDNGCAYDCAYFGLL